MMRALSIRQPHVEAILRGIKQIEHRSAPTNVLGRFYIYASLSRYPVDQETNILREYGIFDQTPFTLPRGLIVGSVELYKCEGGNWLLRNPQRLDQFLKPIQKPQPRWFNPF